MFSLTSRLLFTGFSDLLESFRDHHRWRFLEEIRQWTMVTPVYIESENAITDRGPTTKEDAVIPIERLFGRVTRMF
jgi:hypothetical protein